LGSGVLEKQSTANSPTVITQPTERNNRSIDCAPKAAGYARDDKLSGWSRTHQAGALKGRPYTEPKQDFSTAWAGNYYFSLALQSGANVQLC